MKKISLIMIMLLIQSCSNWSSKAWRNPAMSNVIEGPADSLDSFQCQLELRVHKHFEIHYYTQNKLISFLEHKLIMTNLDDCSTKEFALKLRDRFMTVIPSEDQLYFHTLHGKVLVLNQDKLRTLEIPFPVNAFEIDQNRMSVYSANDQGRFCSFAELKKQKSHRDSSCRSVALILPL